MKTKVIKFYADWCGPCRVYASTFDKVSKDLGEQIEFLNINIDKDTTGLTKEYKVTSIPTTVVINNGKEKKHSGRMDEQELINYIISE